MAGRDLNAAAKSYSWEVLAPQFYSQPSSTYEEFTWFRFLPTYRSDENFRRATALDPYSRQRSEPNDRSSFVNLSSTSDGYLDVVEGAISSAVKA